MADTTVNAQNDIEIGDIDPAELRTTDTGDYGITDQGFVPKPYARLVKEGMALAEYLFGPDVDIHRGSVIRRLVELTSVENARTHAMLARMADDLTIPTARGEALSRLGEEIGIARPFLSATGTVTLKLVAPLPDGVGGVTIPAGARMISADGRHHVATLETVRLTENRKDAQVPVEAFYPGPEHNLNPSNADQVLNLWNGVDATLSELAGLVGLINSAATMEDVVKIVHDTALSGGDLRWPDERYRRLLLHAPRSVWSVEAILHAVSLVPGVRQAKVVDLYGGLDIEKSIFGNFAFFERVFSAERDLVSPYYFSVLVATTTSAIWDGVDGVAALVAEVMEDLRPLGIYPQIRKGVDVRVGVSAKLVIKGLPFPSGDSESVNASQPALELKKRIISRIRNYIDNLTFGEDVSPAKLSWLILNEPGVADVKELTLYRYPQDSGSIDLTASIDLSQPEYLACNESILVGEDEVPTFIDDVASLTII